MSSFPLCRGEKVAHRERVQLKPSRGVQDLPLIHLELSLTEAVLEEVLLELEQKEPQDTSGGLSRALMEQLKEL